MALDSNHLILIAKSLGFGRVGVVNLDPNATPGLGATMQRYRDWLARGHAGEMDYLARHAELREQPHKLLARPAQILRAIVVTLDYLPRASLSRWQEGHGQGLADPSRAVVSVYAHGRDYHKVLRQRLTQLAAQLNQNTHYQFRACVDSAPVLEVELAKRCGLGWRGKHTLLLNRAQGSMFFIGVLLTDMPLPPTRFEPLQTESDEGHCGSCTQCLSVCPTQAFVAPYQLDARRCISYLTIELKGSIPETLRPLMGNRVYGCDDCQQVCPWNQYAQAATLPDFDVRHGLDVAQLVELFSWTAQQFHDRHQGSAILRIGYARWLRNLAVAMGNSLARPDTTPTLRNALIVALQQRTHDDSALVREHVQWALHCADKTLPAHNGNPSENQQESGHA